MEKLVAASDIVKVSHEDLAWAYPGADPAALAARWQQELGPALVVVTFGDDGALAVHGNGTVRRTALATSTVDTVGAGDTFTAGLLHWLARHERLARPGLAALTEPELAAALAYAAAAASPTCVRPGADPPHAHEVDHVLAAVPTG